MTKTYESMKYHSICVLYYVFTCRTQLIKKTTPGSRKSACFFVANNTYIRTTYTESCTRQ